MDLIDHLTRVMDRQWDNDPPPRWLVGVSGGADSMALLSGLERVARSRSLTLIAAHLNHRTHPRSDEAEVSVRRWCQQHDVSYVGASVVAPDQLKEGREGFEARARRLRRTFFRQAARAVETEVVTLAHHRDDQVETVLLNIGRGSGLFGLAGMSVHTPFDDGRCLFRPLLDVPGDALRRYVRRNDVPFVEDPTNRSLDRARNRLRHQVLPAWNEGQPDPRTAIHRLGRRARRENQFWEQFLEDRFETWWWEDECQVDLSTFRAGHPAAQRRLLHRMLYHCMGEEGGWDEGNLEDLRELFLDGSSGQRVTLPNGFRGIREYDRGVVYTGADEHPYRVDVTEVEGSIRLPRTGQLYLYPVGKDEVPGGSPMLTSTLCLGSVSELAVRSWDPGDRLPDAAGGESIKQRFHREQVPFRARRRWPLLVSSGRVLCAPGLGASPDASRDGEKVRVFFRPEAPCFHQWFEQRDRLA